MKRLTALILSLVMILSLAACSGSGDGGLNDRDPNSSSNPGSSSQPNGQADKIVLWTLSNDLKQFAERYTEQTGNEVEVVVFDSADFETKIMQTLGTRSKDVDIFVGEPQMLPNFYEAGFCADLSQFDSEVATRLVDYTYEVGKDENGVLRAISYQATPGAVIYRRDLALEVFGTDDPATIGEKFASFSAIEATAKQLKDAGYTIFGDTGALRWFSKHEAFVRQGVERLIEILDISQGKALVLFTAKTDLEGAFAILRKKKLSYKILIQQPGASQDQVLKEFREDENSVLLGTGAYWEGIDVRGKSLSNLVIFRLPFPVPDPIIEYKASLAKNQLMEVRVPEMIIKLKQGIGRLIRGFADTGIVSIIDPRLRDKPAAPYRDITWASLPIHNRTTSLNELREFYHALTE